ncbi:MAG: hypothetical protein ABFS17_10910 [Chloroflexota bacterium]
MTDQDENKYEDKPVYLNELDDGSRPPAQPKSAAGAAQRKAGKRKASRGASPGNSFVISVLLFIFVLVAGIAALLLTGKISLPI